MTTPKTKTTLPEPKVDLVRRYREIGIAAVAAAAMMASQAKAA
jgi:hypothetical protein